MRVILLDLKKEQKQNQYNSDGKTKRTVQLCFQEPFFNSFYALLYQHSLALRFLKKNLQLIGCTHLCGTCLAPLMSEMMTFPSPDRDMLLAPPSFLDPAYPSQLARSIKCSRDRPPWTKGEQTQNTSFNRPH